MPLSLLLKEYLDKFPDSLQLVLLRMTRSQSLLPSSFF
jgi:hypothetical protein